MRDDDWIEAPGHVGIALLWHLVASQMLDGAKQPAEETAVDAPCPAGFQLVADAPSGDAAFPLEDAYLEPGDAPDARIAMGYLLGYADGNRIVELNARLG